MEIRNGNGKIWNEIMKTIKIHALIRLLAQRKNLFLNYNPHHVFVTVPPRPCSILTKRIKQQTTNILILADTHSMLQSINNLFTSL